MLEVIIAQKWEMSIAVFRQNQAWVNLFFTSTGNLFADVVYYPRKEVRPMKKEKLSPALSAQIAADRKNDTIPPVAFDAANIIRRHPRPGDEADLVRSGFMRDTDKIMYCPYYNR